MFLDKMTSGLIKLLLTKLVPPYVTVSLHGCTVSGGKKHGQESLWAASGQRENHNQLEAGIFGQYGVQSLRHDTLRLFVL